MLICIDFDSRFCDFVFISLNKFLKPRLCIFLQPFRLPAVRDDSVCLKPDVATDATSVHLFEPTSDHPSPVQFDFRDLEAASPHTPSNPLNRLLQAYSNIRLRLVRVCWHRPHSPSPGVPMAADGGWAPLTLLGVLLTLTIILLLLHLTIGAGSRDRGEAVHFVCVFSFLLLCQMAVLYSHLVRLSRQRGGCPSPITQVTEALTRWGRHLSDCFRQPWLLFWQALGKSRVEAQLLESLVARVCLYIALCIILLVFLAFFVIQKNPSNLISLSGIFFMVFLCILLSFHPGKIRWRPVFMGFFIQFCLAVLTLQTKFGYMAFQYVGARVADLMNNGLNGAHFVFGGLVRQDIFAFTVLPVIVFFSSLVAVLHHAGFLRVCIIKPSRFIHKVMGTTGPESVNAVANIFLSMIRWRPVFMGFFIQFCLAVLTLQTKFGYMAFQYVGARVADLMNNGLNGAHFVFGGLVRQDIFAFTVLPVIVFFSSLVAVLHHAGFLRVCIIKPSRFIHKVMGTTGPESVNAVANIFLSMNEAPLLLKPFLQRMTNSELFAIMVNGFSSIAGSVMVVYINLGAPANHLLIACVLSAPAALAIAKIMYPETKAPLSEVDINGAMKMRQVCCGHECSRTFRPSNSPYTNIIEAATLGALDAIPLCAGIAANLMAALSMFNLFNNLLVWIGRNLGMHRDLTLELLKEESLDDRKPSELLRRMRSLLGDMQVDDKIVKEMFLERLPVAVQTILAPGSQDLAVSQLVEMADRMIEVQRFQSPSVAQISTSSSTVNEHLMKQVSAMADEMVFLKLQLVRLTSSRSCSRRRSRSRPRTANPSANCSPIPTFGSLSLTLNIGLRRSFTWILVIADIPRAIFGSDFLAEFDLLVDCRRAHLLDRKTGLSVRGLTPFTVPTNLSVFDTDIASPFRQLLLSHPKITNPRFCSVEVQHDDVHHIRTSSPTVSARPRPLAPERFQAAKADFEHMLQLGIIRPS
ncbi:hypothetical protein SprV_0401483400 [Sparganum proliferum]